MNIESSRLDLRFTRWADSWFGWDLISAWEDQTSSSCRRTSYFCLIWPLGSTHISPNQDDLSYSARIVEWTLRQTFSHLVVADGLILSEPAGWAVHTIFNNYRFCCTVTAHFRIKDQFTILRDIKIYSIKVVKTHLFSGRLSNLSQLPEINYPYKKSVFCWKILNNRFFSIYRQNSNW